MVDYDKTLGSRIFDKINIILLFLVILVTLYPFYYITIVSLSNGNAVLRGEVSLWPVGFTLDSYKLVFQNPAVPLSLRNSLVYTTLGTLINLGMTTLCAYPLARPRFSGRKVFTWVVTLTMFFSGGLIPLYLLIMQLGLINNMWALLLPGAINVWNMFIMRTSFQQIPEELYEAALIDGANDLQTLIRIVLPVVQSGPGDAADVLCGGALERLLQRPDLSERPREVPDPTDHAQHRDPGPLRADQ